LFVQKGQHVTLFPDQISLGKRLGRDWGPVFGNGNTSRFSRFGKVWGKRGKIGEDRRRKKQGYQ
jgi:hypothetical protein